MTRAPKPKASAPKATGKTKVDADKTKDRKPLHEALGPAAKDFGQEVKPLGRELGQLTVKTVRTLLIKPVENTIWGLEKASEAISSRVSEKLAGKKPEELKEPDARIALPTLQAMMYSGDDESVREMFANLLASGMTKTTSSKVHPAFVELIKQMTADDAMVLSHIAANTGQARFELRLINDINSNSFRTVGFRLTFTSKDPTDSKNDDLLVALSNLERLGLVQVDDAKYPNNDLVKTTMDSIKNSYDAVIDKEKQRIDINPAGIFITPLGDRFVQICLPDAKPAAVVAPGAPSPQHDDGSQPASV